MQCCFPLVAQWLSVRDGFALALTNHELFARLRRAFPRCLVERSHESDWANVAYLEGLRLSSVPPSLVELLRSVSLPYAESLPLDSGKWYTSFLLREHNFESIHRQLVPVLGRIGRAQAISKIHSWEHTSTVMEERKARATLSEIFTEYPQRFDASQWRALSGQPHQQTGWLIEAQHTVTKQVQRMHFLPTEGQANLFRTPLSPDRQTWLCIQIAQ
jgi:hypothetical protein